MEECRFKKEELPRCRSGEFRNTTRLSKKSTLKTFPGTEVLVEILFCRICLDFVFLLGILSDYVIYILYQIPQVKVLI